MSTIELLDDKDMATAPKLKMPVKIGIAKEVLVDVEIGQGLIVVIEAAAASLGCRVEEIILTRDGHAEILATTLVIDAEYPHHRRHHAHPVRDVQVKVYYQAGEHELVVRPHATIDEVLTWAIKVFGIDANLATEFELERHGEKGELPGAEHVGHVAEHHHTLALDLVRGIIANGAGDDR